MKTKVVVVDDHVIVRTAISNLINSFGNYEVTFQFSNGREFAENLDFKNLPDLVLLDINMPEMDGYQACLWLQDNYPHIKVLALSMYENENLIIRMFRAGAKGYILKNCSTSELKDALFSVIQKGFYYSEMVTGKLIHTINNLEKLDSSLNLKNHEITFLKLICTELTYKEIGEKMFVSVRTVEGYRDNLCEKLNLKTRTGLAMFAIRNKIVEI